MHDHFHFDFACPKGNNKNAVETASWILETTQYAQTFGAWKRLEISHMV